MNRTTFVQRHAVHHRGMMYCVRLPFLWCATARGTSLQGDVPCAVARGPSRARSAVAAIREKPPHCHSHVLGHSLQGPLQPGAGQGPGSSALSDVRQLANRGSAAAFQWPQPIRQFPRTHFTQRCRTFVQSDLHCRLRDAGCTETVRVQVCRRAPAGRLLGAAAQSVLLPACCTALWECSPAPAGSTQNSSAHYSLAQD